MDTNWLELISKTSDVYCKAFEPSRGISAFWHPAFSFSTTDSNSWMLYDTCSAIFRSRAQGHLLKSLLVQRNSSEISIIQKSTDSLTFVVELVQQNTVLQQISCQPAYELRKMPLDSKISRVIATKSPVKDPAIQHSPFSMYTCSCVNRHRETAERYIQQFIRHSAGAETTFTLSFLIKLGRLSSRRGACGRAWQLN